MIFQVNEFLIISVLGTIIKLINNLDNEKRNEYLKILIDCVSISLIELNKNSIKQDMKNKNSYCKKMISIIIFLYIIIFNIENHESLKYIFTLNNEVLLNTLKDILKNFSNNNLTLLPEILISICFNDFKYKIVRYSNQGKEQEDINLFLKIFNILFQEYPKPSITYFKHNEDENNEIFNNFNNIIENVKINEIDNFFQGIVFYCFKIDNFDIYNFYENIVKNHIQITKTNNSDISSLFRKDDIYHIILKNTVFNFCNYSFINSIYKNLKKQYLNIFEKDFNIENFDKFFQIFIDSIFNTIPDIIKVIMKIIYVFSIKEYNIQKNNYSPIYTFLFFDFYISPKIFDIYKMSFSDYNSIKLLNKVIRNIFFKKYFNENDILYPFNSIIEKCFNLINSKMEEKLNLINLDNKNEINILMKSSISNISFPQFLENYGFENLKKFIK